MRKSRISVLALLMALPLISLFLSCGDGAEEAPLPGADSTMSGPDADTTKFTDPRDGQTYDLVYINGITWFAENANYDTNEGVSPRSDSASYRCYQYYKGYCTSDGGLYTFNTAKAVCPAGFHLSTKAEWDTLINIAGGPKEAGKALKVGGELSFNIEMAGFWLENYGNFGGRTSNANFWLVDENGQGYFRQFFSTDDNTYAGPVRDAKDFYCVRCVKDR